MESIKKALQDRRLQVVADATGIHYNTLLSIRNGKNDNPRLETAIILRKYLFGDKEVKE